MARTLRLYVLITSAVYGMSLDCLAGQFSYMCEVKNVFVLSDEGTLAHYSGESAIIGQQFTIDRRSGRVIGKVLDNDLAVTVQVIHPGSSEQAFKLLSIGRGPYIEAYYIIVEEYSKQPKKPFVGITTTQFYTGLCD